MASTDNIRLNFERAAEHLNVLNQALDVFYASAPCIVTKHFDTQNQRDIYRLQLTKIPDMRLGVLAGDFLYNSRACLDHLFWQLVLIESGGEYPPKPKRIEFPISNNADTSNDARKKLDWLLRQIPKDARSIIESLQPYIAGQTDESRRAHPLYCLDALFNIAKHRVIPIQGMMGEMDVLAVTGTTYTFLNNATIEVSIPTPHPEFPPPRAGITFGSAEEGMNIDASIVGKIYDFIRVDTLPKFARFFPQDSWFQAMMDQ